MVQVGHMKRKSNILSQFTSLCEWKKHKRQEIAEIKHFWYIRLKYLKENIFPIRAEKVRKSFSFFEGSTLKFKNIEINEK